MATMSQAPGTAQPSSSAEMIQQNFALRTALLQSAPKMRKTLGQFSGGTPGTSTRVKLFNVGITTNLFLLVEAPIAIGVAPGTLSPKAPYNLIDRIKVTDFDGTDRVNCSGYQLWVLNSVRRQTPSGLNNGALADVVTLPNAPVSVGNHTVRFLIQVPICYDSSRDLRGALLTQTAVGEAFVTIDWNPLLYANGNADAVYNGAGTTTVALQGGQTISVTVDQEYLLPQAVNGKVPMPMLDLMTVYEVAGAVRSSDNIANGAEKLFNYPNLRSVIGAYYNFINNGVMNSAVTDLSKLRLIANGNNVLREYGPYQKLMDMRYALEADLKVGTYFELHREKPIETALFGNVQYGITPSSVSGANTNFEVMYESFYTKGSILPGLNQG